MKEFGEHYVRGLGMSAHNSALAYGYSITVTASFGILARTDGPVAVLRIFVFVIGPSLAFAGINALVTRGFRQRVEHEPPVVASLATAFGFLSISGAVGVAALVGGASAGGWPGCSARCCRLGRTCQSQRWKWRSRGRCISRSASRTPRNARRRPDAIRISTRASVIGCTQGPRGLVERGQHATDKGAEPEPLVELDRLSVGLHDAD